MDFVDEDYGAEVTPLDVKKKQPISFQMLIKRHLPPEAAKIWSQEDIFEKLNQISHVRLDRERINKLDGLELLGRSVTNLYLQSNYIEKIENLESLTGLTFLALGSNQVKQLQELTRLSKLAFLDLSHNQIKTLYTDELPWSLVILDLRGNPCTDMSDYRQKRIQDLPNLRRLDGQDVTRAERIEAGFAVSSEDEDEESEEEDESTDADTYIEGIFKTVTSDIVHRAKNQMGQVMLTHDKRMEELDTIRSQTQLDFNKCDSRATVHDVISVQHLESHDTRSQSSGSRSLGEQEERLNSSRSRSASPDTEHESDNHDSDEGVTVSPHRAGSGSSILLSPFGLLPQGMRPSSGSGSGLGTHAPLGPISKT